MSTPAPRGSAVCTFCGERRRVQARWGGRPVCGRCYFDRRRVPCQTCGVSCQPYAKGTCARCVAAARLEALLADRPELEPVREELLSRDDPKQAVMHWLRFSQSGKYFAQLAAGEIEVSHDALDELESPAAADYLRTLLVTSGVLPPNQIGVHRVEAWLSRKTADLGSDGRIVELFARWSVVRRLRAAEQRGELTPGKTRWGRAELSAAVGFVQWLHDRDLDVASCQQTDLDLYTASGPSTRRIARSFVRWCAANDHMGSRLEVAARVVILPADATDEEAYWAKVRELLHGEIEIDLRDRVAALLVLLFAQPISRLVQLRRADVVHTPGSTAVDLAGVAVDLPAPLDGLVAELAASDQSEWLFPGSWPGTALSTITLGRHLRRIGVEPRTARKQAIFIMSRSIPAPVVADLIGVHPKTAARWAAITQRDWTGYAAGKARQVSR